MRCDYPPYTYLPFWSLPARKTYSFPGMAVAAFKGDKAVCRAVDFIRRVVFFMNHAPVAAIIGGKIRVTSKCAMHQGEVHAFDTRETLKIDIRTADDHGFFYTHAKTPHPCPLQEHR